MRCNCGIDPKNLTDEHLFAESRELKMLPALFGRIGMKHFGQTPTIFTLGKGHMLFFLYKWEYSLWRYSICVEELKRRGYNVISESNRWNIYQQFNCLEQYKETGKEANIVRQRIIERIQNSSKKYFHYNHKRITKEEAINLLF